MLSIIKTAIITIIISFISGVLLDHYKNMAPKIVCTVKKVKKKNNQSQNSESYMLSIKNISNRTIHDLNLNIHSRADKFDAYDAKITRGLKFDIENDEDFYDISVPFLSKGDEFSVKVYLSDSDKDNLKPILSLRSPENFKRVYKGKENEIENDLPDKNSKVFKNNNNDVKQKKDNFIKNIFFKNKKTVLTTVAGIVCIFVVVFACDKFISSIRNKDVDIEAPASNNLNSSDDKNDSSNTDKRQNSQNNNSSNSKKTSNESKNKDTKNTKSNDNSQNKDSSSKNNSDSTKQSGTSDKKEKDSSENTNNEQNTVKSSNNNEDNNKTQNEQNSGSNVKDNNSNETK